MHARLALLRRAPLSASAFAARGPAPGDVIVERPDGLARGRVAWPPWAIAILGGGVVLMALVYYLLRLRSGRR